MKTILILFGLIASSVVDAQVTSPVFPIVNDQIVYAEVVPIDSNITTEQQRSRVKLFLNQSATSHNGSVNFEKSKIKDYVILDNPSEVSGNVRVIANRGIVSTLFEATLTVEFKQGRYRYTLDNIRYLANNLDGQTNGRLLSEVYNIKKSSGMIKAFDARFRKLIEDFKLSMNKENKPDF